MTLRHEISDAWRDNLASAGIDRFPGCFAEPAGPAKLPGRWAALTKPGLRGRERWRWEWSANKGPAKAVYVKRYARSSWRIEFDRWLHQSVRHSRAWWEYRQSIELLDAHIGAPRPVGFAEWMQFGVELRSLVMLEEVSGDAFDRVWRRAVEAGWPIVHGIARRDLTRRLGRFISAFHHSGRCHRDLYLCHVFVDLDPAMRRPPEFALIDLARVLYPRWRRMRWILKDLSQLDSSARQIGATRTDRWRFLLAYLGLQAGAPRARYYAQRVSRKSERILRRIERKSRRA